jgi:hypothetical protein
MLRWIETVLGFYLPFLHLALFGYNMAISGLINKLLHIGIKGLFSHYHDSHPSFAALFVAALACSSQ